MGFWHAYMGIEGGGLVEEATDYITTRFSLIGTSQQRQNLVGTSQQRQTLVGSNG